VINYLLLYQNYVKTITGIESMRANNLILTVILFAFSLSGLAQSGALDIVKTRYPLIYTYIVDDADKQWGDKRAKQMIAEEQARAFLSIAQPKRALDSRLLGEAIVNNSLPGSRDYNIKIINDRELENPYGFLYCDWVKVKEYYNNEILSPGSMSRQAQEPKRDYPAATAPQNVQTQPAATDNTPKTTGDSRNHVSDVQNYDNNRQSQPKDQGYTGITGTATTTQRTGSSVSQPATDTQVSDQGSYVSRTESSGNNQASQVQPQNRRVEPQPQPANTRPATQQKATDNTPGVTSNNNAPAADTRSVQSYDRVSEVREYNRPADNTSTYQRNTNAPANQNRGAATGTRRYSRDYDDYESSTKPQEKPFSVGVKAEAGMVTMLGFNDWDAETDILRHVSPSVAFGGGIAAIYKKNGLFIQNETGVQYGSLNLKFTGPVLEDEPDFRGDFKYKINNLYLNTALHFGGYVNAGKNVQFVAGVGPFAAWNLSSKIKNVKLVGEGETIDLDEYVDFKSEIKKFNYGVTGIFGFDINNKVRLALYPSYGFANLDPDYNSKLFNVMFGITVWAF